MNREKLIEDMARAICCPDGSCERRDHCKKLSIIDGNQGGWSNSLAEARAALSAAERAIAEEWREKAAILADEHSQASCTGMGSEAAASQLCARSVAAAIRALPLPGDE